MNTSQYLDARKMLVEFETGEAPKSLPVGEFRARHYGPDLDCDRLENYFNQSNIKILSVEVIRVGATADFVYVLERH